MKTKTLLLGTVGAVGVGMILSKIITGRWNPLSSASAAPSLGSPSSTTSTTTALPPSTSPLAAKPVLRDLGNPITLQAGHHYRAHVELSASDLALAGSNLKDLVQVLAQLTFAGAVPDLKVYGPGDALPANWPPETTANRGPGSLYFEGTYSGMGSVNSPRSPKIVTIWEQ